jgi:transmembrane sensor
MPTDSNSIEIEASEWLARLDRTDATDEDRAAFERWRDADPRHMAAYARLESAWGQLDRVRALRPASSQVDADILRPSADAAIQRPADPEILRRPYADLDEQPGDPGTLRPADPGARRPGGPGTARPGDQGTLRAADPTTLASADPSTLRPADPGALAPAGLGTERPGSAATARSAGPGILRPGIEPDFLQRSVFASRRRVLATAAALLFAVIAGWVLWLQSSGSTYVTGVGGFQRVVLSDGSVLELNTNTSVRVSLDASRRAVELLQGEASFEIARDATRPFIVAVGDTAVRAVGTRFNVRRLNESVEVIVNEGKVIVGPQEALTRIEAPLPPSAPIVTAGHTAVARAATVTVNEVPPAIAARKLAWQERMLAFDGVPLVEVIAEFNRYNERQLVLADPSLAAIRIGGYFRPTNLQAFIDVLEEHFDIRATTAPAGILLTAAPPEPK